MKNLTLIEVHTELKALAFCSAVRHLMHHSALTRKQTFSLIADHCWVSLHTVTCWEQTGVPENHVDAMLELLNSRSPWARHQLAPRMKEAEIWRRVNIYGMTRVA